MWTNAVTLFANEKIALCFLPLYHSDNNEPAEFV